MLKLNESQDFEDGSVSILDLTKSLEKSAACSDIADFVSTLKPVPGRSYLHINMLGSSEHYGNTKNGDFFPEAALIKYHKTFQTNPAKFFKHHMNKATSPSYGICVFSTYNHAMHRIELIVEADEDTTIELNKLMASGMYPKTSMACRLPYDTCSICGNQAKTRADYCSHLSTEMNKLYPDGRKVYSINSDNISWFDCSWVARPADPTSSILVKVANETTIGAAEMAEIEGLTEKKAEFKKWAELVKEITESGQVLENVSGILSKTKDLPLHLVPTLSQVGLNQSLAAMALLGISPSIEFLAELIANHHLGEGYEGIGVLVEEYLKQVNPDEQAPNVHFDDVETPNPLLVQLLSKYANDSSLFPSAIEKRASGVGYAHNGPHIEPTWEEEQAIARANLPTNQEVKVPYGKLLLGIGASALLAKWYISSQIEKKMREQRLHSPQNTIKIELIKRASDYQVAADLSRATMKPYVSPQRENDGSGVNLPSSTSIARKFLASSKTKVGGKLSSLLRAIGIGQKVSDAVLQP
jgi:hypothetical protein